MAIPAKIYPRTGDRRPMMYHGKSGEKKTALAKRLQKAAREALCVDKMVISVSVEEVAEEGGMRTSEKNIDKERSFVNAGFKNPAADHSNRAGWKNTPAARPSFYSREAVGFRNITSQSGPLAPVTVTDKTTTQRPRTSSPPL